MKYIAEALVIIMCTPEGWIGLLITGFFIHGIISICN
jgi:hypothetical protein